MLTQREAATACGVSRTTIRRRREDGDLPGAIQDPPRGWLIPVEDLLAAGFRLNAPAGPDPDTSPAGVVEHGGHHQEHGVDAEELRAELERARSELVQDRHGQELAEADARALREQLVLRQEHVADLQRALAAMPAPERGELTAAPPVVPGQSRPGPAVPADASLRNRGGAGGAGDADRPPHPAGRPCEGSTEAAVRRTTRRKPGDRVV
ncbi:helix-turn-helix transcriptional regulator [Streptomyces sp. NPDC058301]|uniref:helix-turn-helix transcriptional regulator n=1 Tax=Streptomyces sp. NPDC058301 TaxID=3346436 RepID=UPI0036EFFA63